MAQFLTAIDTEEGVTYVLQTLDRNQAVAADALRLIKRVVKLWQIPGANLLQADDVGLIPWVPLTDLSYLRSNNVDLWTIL